MHTSSKLSVANFLWQMLFARVDEKTCQIPVFICQRKFVKCEICSCRWIVKEDLGKIRSQIRRARVLWRFYWA